MNLARVLEEKYTDYLERQGCAWWVEIVTASPRCTYYFGPFMTKRQAQDARPGYVADLEEEGACGIAVCVSRCQPQELTIVGTPD
ncbi:DUF1816 domain-containing protein [Oxynema aestuarii]|uniref:DUF1816 domain-containing protein n=1 Tax=Oxynema aestuarii AP17 TaxID=2064643 RepID=A0A6H1TXT4_9CYAN|nr:DUF1816 domain-containing protein [Oxynema aestuarii]QIZ71391.1 DUF1816 domain-containing protein [Oxynema aestuarii AP17]